MRSPVVAMLWENWRLTRLEAAWRLSLGLVGGSAVLAGFGAVTPNEAAGDFGATGALVIIVLVQVTLWQSIAKLNGGRFLDGYRPGFPFHLLYTRPVRTAVLVGIPMAYGAASAAALYLVSALVLRSTFDYPFLLLPGAACIAALHMVQAASNWATRNKIVQWLGTGVPVAVFGVLAMQRWEGWPAQLDFSLADYALIASIGLASFGVAVAGVARQRRGEAPLAMPWTAGLGGFPAWLVGLLRFPCPTSSAARAQAWFELKSSGLPVLTVGLVFAMAIPLLYAVSGPVAPVRPYATMFAGLALVSVLFLGGNAFGVRRKQGHVYASAFELTQPYGTARLAGLKALVRAVSVLAALIVVGVSLWASLSLVSRWDGSHGAATLLQWRNAIEMSVGALSGYRQAALAIVLVIGVAVMVTSRAALEVVWARYPRRLTLAGSLLLLYGLAFILRALAGPGGSGLKTLVDTLFLAAPWLAAAAIVLATVYLFWTALAEKLLTLGQACGAVLVSAAFGAAWVTVLRAAGVQLAGVPPADAVWTVSPILLPLTASLLAPWSLSRVRHT